VFVGTQSKEHFERVIDEWMKDAPFRGMEREEVRKIIKGLEILMQEKMRDAEEAELVMTPEVMEEARRLGEKASSDPRGPEWC